MAAVLQSGRAMNGSDVPTATKSDSKSLPSVQEDMMYGVNVAACHIDVRMGFVRKVFGIVGAQLLCTIMFCAAAMSNPSIKEYAQKHQNIQIFCGIASIASLFSLIANRHKSPLNFQLLGVFTIVLSTSVALTISMYDNVVVIQAAMVCASVTAGLIAYTFQTKHDFTGMLSICMTGLWVLIGLGFVQAFFPFSSSMDAMISCVAACLFSLFIIVDVQRMLKKTSTDEYILCAINLYLDILNLFLEILRVMNSRN